MNKTQFYSLSGALLASTALTAGSSFLPRSMPGLPGVRNQGPVFAPDGGGANAPKTIELTEEALAKMIADAAQKAVDAAVAPLQKQVTDNLAKMTVPATPAAPAVKGQNVSRIIQALAATKGIPSLAAQFAQNKWKSDADAVCKALSASDNVQGGFFVPEDMSREVIELLRPASVVMSMNPITLPLPNGNLSMPRVATGTSGSYIGEQQNIGVTGITAGQMKLAAKKLAALVPVSNDLLRFQGVNPGADSIVRDDLIASLAQTADLKFIRGNGTEYSPMGLRYLANSANVLAVNATVNLANVTLDLGRAELALIGNNIPMLRPGWIMAPRTFIYLSDLRDGNGNKAFPELGQMMLRGKPVKFTTQIPINLSVTGTNESEIYLVDFAQVVVGEVEGIVIDVSSEAAYHDGSNVVAAFSRDETVVRAILQHDINVRHTYAVAVLKDVDWGA